MPLTVPKQYKLLNYESIDPSFIRYDYTTHSLARSLPAGAEDELIQLDEPSVTIASPRSSEKPTIVQPQVPSSLLKAPIYHPLTAFVSSSRQKKKPSAKLFKTLIRILHLVS